MQSDANETTVRRRPVRRAFRILFWCVFTLIVLAFAGAGAGWVYLSRVDWKSVLEEQATLATGRQVTIEGRMTPTVYPWLGVEARQVRIAQPDWRAAQTDRPFIAANSLKLHVDLYKLIFDKVILLDRIKLRRPVIDLAVDAEGRTNWQDLEQALSSQAASADGAADDFMGYTLQGPTWSGLAVSYGSVYWSHGGTGESGSAENITLTAGAGETFDFSVSFIGRYDPLHLNGRVTAKGDCWVDQQNETVSFEDTRLQVDFDLDGQRVDASLFGDCRIDLNGGRVVVDRASLDADVALPVAGRPLDLALGGILMLDTEGDVSLEDMELTLPGVEVSGRVAAAMDTLMEPQLEGAVSVQVTDAGALPVPPDVPEYFLRNARLAGEVAVVPEGVTISGMELRTAETSFTGNAKWLFADGGRVECAVTTSTLDVDAIRGHLAANSASSGAGSPLAAVYSPVGVQATIRSDTVVVGGEKYVGVSASLRTSPRDFTLSCSVDSLFGGAGKASLKGRARKGTNEYNLEAELRSVAGGAVTRLLGVDHTLAASGDVTLDLSGRGADLDEVMHHMDGSVALALGAGEVGWKTDEEANGETESFSFDSLSAKVAARSKPGAAEEARAFTTDADVQLELEGSSAKASLRTTAFIDMAAGELVGLGESKLSGAWNGPAFGLDVVKSTFQAKGDVDLDLGRLRLREYRVDALGITVSGALEAENIFAEASFRGNVKTSKFVPRDVFDRIGLELWTISNPRSFGQCGLTASVVGTLKELDPETLTLKIDDLDLTLDQTTFTGMVELQNMEGPVVGFDLAADKVDCDKYRNREDDAEDDGAEPPRKLDPNAEARAEPLSEPPLGGLKARGRLQVGNFKLYSFRGENVTTPVRIENSAIILNDVQGGFYGGTVNGTLRVELYPKLYLTTDAHAKDFELQELLGDLFDFKRIAGNTDLDMTLETRGETYDGRIFSLGGEATLEVTEGYHTFFGPQAPPAKPDPSLSSWQQALVDAREKGRSPFRLASAHVTGEGGVMRNDNLVLEGQLINAKGSGVIDLVEWLLEYDINYDITGLPTIPVRIRGSIDEPDVNVSLPAMVGQTLGRIGGTTFDIVTGVLGLPFKVLETLADGVEDAATTEEDEQQENTEGNVPLE